MNTKQIFDSMPDTFYAGDIPSKKKNWILPVAAAVILVPLLAWGLSVWTKTQPKASRMLADVSYYVDKGVKGQVDLQDGTTVNLNSGSSLKVLGERRVFLDGEGWFDVQSDPEHPFFVETPSGIAVKVTGTQFNLSNYKRFFPEFTDHTNLHSVTVINFCNQLIGDQIERMNADERG